jgi:pyruvate dehydrogenase E2 component (dihydrolipoamide acetyltransferase)
VAQFLMPKLSDTMEEGTILQWLVGDGDEVERGQPVVEIETDKANMTVEAPASGTLQVIAGEGDVLPVGEPIAAIGGGGEEAADEDDGRTEIPTADDGTPAEIGADLDLEETYPGAREADAAEAEEAEEPEVAAEDAPAEPEPAEAPRGRAPGRSPDEGGRVKASPLARRLAGEKGVDLATVHGTGPDGRIVRADVEAAARGDGGAVRAPRGTPAPTERAARAPGAAPATEAGADAAAGGRIPLSRLQRTIASRMLASVTEAPQFALQRDVDATEAQALRRQLVEAAPEGQGPSLNDLIVRAVAMAAGERPEAVSRFDGDALVRPSGIHVGLAVAVERGLLVPVIRDADRKGVGRIAEESRDLVARCRDGTITPPELEGSVISVSNLGMFGIDRFTAIVNPPETAIVAVGRATPHPVVRDGEVVVRDLMTLTLTIDHRAVYGAEGAVFLGRVAELLERPGALVL